MKRYTWVPIGKKTPNYTLKFNGLLFKKKGIDPLDQSLFLFFAPVLIQVINYRILHSLRSYSKS
jgi:hypothetical protein